MAQSNALAYPAWLLVALLGVILATLPSTQASADEPPAKNQSDVKRLAADLKRFEDVEMEWLTVSKWLDTGELHRFRRTTQKHVGLTSKRVMTTLKKGALAGQTLPKDPTDETWWKRTSAGLVGQQPVITLVTETDRTRFSPWTALPPHEYSGIRSAMPAGKRSARPEPLKGSYLTATMQSTAKKIAEHGAKAASTGWKERALVYRIDDKVTKGRVWHRVVLMDDKHPHLPARQIGVRDATDEAVQKGLAEAKDVESFLKWKKVESCHEVLAWMEVEGFPLLPKFVRSRHFNSRFEWEGPVPGVPRDCETLYAVQSVKKAKGKIGVRGIPKELLDKTIMVMDKRVKSVRTRHPDGRWEDLPHGWK